MIIDTPSKKLLLFIMCLIITFVVCASLPINKNANAHPPGGLTCGSAHGTDCKCDVTCKPRIEECSQQSCECQSNEDTPVTIDHITDEFILHRRWLIKSVWEAHMLPAMMLMTEQISAMALQQMAIIGTMFDAKHQLETQRLLQDMQAQAHKDYQPSKGMCEFGTNTRSLAASDRNSDLTQIAIAARQQSRNLLNGDGISGSGIRDDSRSRMAMFRNFYCNKADAGNGMDTLCNNTDTTRMNRDVNFTDVINQENTLEIDYSDAAITADETDVLALISNLYGEELIPYIPEDKMATQDGRVIKQGASAYMDARALHAKRSIAEASFAAQAAMRAQGTSNIQPYMQAILEEMGIPEDQALERLGERPSYKAQMELLGKTLYQTPNFYTELYDKPSNIERKIVAMQAIELMQRRDAYRSKLRREANEALILETYLIEEQREIENIIGDVSANNPILDVQGLGN